MFGLFKTYCEKCGLYIDGTVVKKFGKKFCSEGHANEFSSEVEAQQRKMPKQKSDGGCCG